MRGRRRGRGCAQDNRQAARLVQTLVVAAAALLVEEVADAANQSNTEDDRHTGNDEASTI